MADFGVAVEKVLKHEGGYTSGLAGDAGLETNFGISQRAYPSVDIRNLTRDAAREIYKHDYWLSLYDSIEDQRLATSLFDFGVNAGTETAVKTMQKALNDVLAGPVLADGVFGPNTLSAVNSAHPEPLLKQFTVRRITYYAKLNKPQFIRAWVERAMDV